MIVTPRGQTWNYDCSGSRECIAGAAMSDSQISRLSLIAAFGLTLLWGATYIAFAYGELCDESGHVGAARHLAERQAGWPALPHPPGYHVFVNALSLNQPHIGTARLTSVVFALLGLVAFAGAWRRLHRAEAGPATLVFALLPILQPFTAMAYTDVTSLAWLLCAWWAQVSGRPFRAAMLTGVACLVRQTNVIWAAFFVVWEAERALAACPDSRPRWRIVVEAARTNGLWHLLLIAASGIVILLHGRFTPSTDHGNELKPNIAAFHLAAWLALVFGAPLWIRHGPAAIRSSRVVEIFRSRRGILWLVLAMLATGLLAATFQNPHEWNRILRGGVRAVRYYIVLRNWLLTSVDAHLSLRLVSGASMVAVALMTALIFRQQPQRRALWFALLFGAILLGTNSLVDPRYYITPAAMLLCLMKVETRTYLWFAAWFALLCAVHAPFILTGRSLW
jgi:hypothetical protein